MNVMIQKSWFLLLCSCYLKAIPHRQECSVSKLETKIDTFLFFWFSVGPVWAQVRLSTQKHRSEPGWAGTCGSE